MTKYESPDYARLGQAVYEARTEAGLGRTVDWVDKTGRSSRVLLGLERGEKVGTPTLNDIEDALGWPRGGAYRVMSGGVPWRELTVGADRQDASYVRRADPTAGDATREEDSAVLRAVNEMREVVDARLRDLSERVERLEQRP